MGSADHPYSPRRPGALAPVLLALALAPVVQAAPEQAPQGEVDVRIGHSEYMGSCAACHGEGGRGDGPLADQLNRPPTDLTRLAADNDGRFPFFEIYQVIEGSALSAHGGREMPVWGPRYRADAQRRLEVVPLCAGETLEELVQGRILRLVAYLRAIQEP